MRKILSIFLIVSIFLSITGCKSENTQDYTSDESDKSVEITKDNFEDYFLITWHWENPTYVKPSGFLDAGVGTLKAEFHVEISPKIRTDVENLSVDIYIRINHEYWGWHEKDETITLRYDGEGHFWVPISESCRGDYTAYLPTKNHVVVEVTNASGKIIQ